jgi:dimethylglycine dehydrogenase
VLCEIVINAAGFYGAHVAAMVGQHIPVTTLEHQYVVTSQLDELSQHSDQFPLIRDPDIKYSITYPHRLLHAARPVNTTPLYERLATKGAQFGQIGGWERAIWFAREPSQQLKGNDGYGHLGFRDDEPWREAVRTECIGVRDCVSVMDHGGFTKFEVRGPGAHAYLGRVFCGALPKPGRIRLGYMLTPNARLWSEATIAHVTPGKYLLCRPTVASDRDHDWLRGLLPVDGTVQLQYGATRDGALMLMGPRSRALLQKLTDVDVSATAQPWMSVLNIDVAGVPVTAMRVSYVGEFGWELHVGLGRLTSPAFTKPFPPQEKPTGSSILARTR